MIMWTIENMHAKTSRSRGNHVRGSSTKQLSHRFMIDSLRLNPTSLRCNFWWFPIFGQLCPSQHGLTHVKGEESPPVTQQQRPHGPMKRMQPSQHVYPITHNMIHQGKFACKALLRTILQHQGPLVLCQRLMVNVDIPLDNFHLLVTLDPKVCLLTSFK